jgi:hypothetical protein
MIFQLVFQDLRDMRDMRMAVFHFFQLSCGTGTSGASGASGGCFYFFLTFPPARSPATNCGYLYLIPEEEDFRPK